MKKLYIYLAFLSLVSLVNGSDGKTEEEESKIIHIHSRFQYPGRPIGEQAETILEGTGTSEFRRVEVLRGPVTYTECTGTKLWDCLSGTLMNIQPLSPTGDNREICEFLDIEFEKAVNADSRFINFKNAREEEKK